jgi:hypothetical protein
MFKISKLRLRVNQDLPFGKIFQKKFNQTLGLCSKLQTDYVIKLNDFHISGSNL